MSRHGLSGPDLPGPDLRGPDLPGPDLPRPDLRGPDLRGPDLPGPDLPGPDLPGSATAGQDPFAPVLRPSGYPFRGPGWVARAAPFAILAVLAEASLALPPDPPPLIATILSVVLLAATGAQFALPWARLPAWATVLVPLTYCGSFLALAIAAGPTSGVIIVALMPVVWTALFHRRWESGCVLAAVVLIIIVYSMVPVMDANAVITRRVLFWAALGALVTVATHGLRRRIQRAQAERARLQGRLHEVSLLADRERIAHDLQERVIQRIFAASLSLQAVGSLTAGTDLGRRIEGATGDLDEATKLLRESIFGLRGQPGGVSIQREVLDLCGEFATQLGGSPDVSFDGSIAEELPARSADWLLRALRETLAAIGEQPERVQVTVTVTAGLDARLTVVLPGRWPPEPGSGDLPDPLMTLRDRASESGAVIAVGAEAGGGTRLAWRIPLGQAGDT